MIIPIQDPFPMARQWKLAFLAGLGYAQQNEDDVIASLAGIGYDGIEWTTAHFNPDRPLAELQRLVEKTRAAGLEVSRIMAHEDLVCLDDAERERRIAQTLRVIEAAGACGVHTVGTMTGPAPWDPGAPKIGRDISEGAAWDMVLDAYQRFGDAARAAGVVISSEGVFGMVAHDFYTHRHLLDQLPAEVHQVNLDPSHGVLYGNLDVGWVVRQWGGRIAHVHLKDAVGIPEMGKFQFPMLGEGNVDWSAFFGALDEIGYSGFCSVEFESFGYLARVLKGDAEAAARLSFEQVSALLEAR
jgi:sugar phosphate isomerase/epimerase